MRSMTGFGVGDSPLGGGRVSMESRSVNHRTLDVRVRMPRELVEHSVFVEQQVRARLSRGRVEVSVHSEGMSSEALVLDRERALGCLRAFESLSLELGRTEPAPLSLLACVPDLFVPRRSQCREAEQAALSEAVERSMRDLDAMRAREGRNLSRDLSERLGAVRGQLERVASRVPTVTARHQARFRERVERLLEGVGQKLGELRIEQELAILAEHMDVAEELTRLQSHCEGFEEMLGASEPVGRRMDFLLQEMAREVNTLGSKASDAEVSQRVIEMKVEIERMREQAQNVE